LRLRAWLCCSSLLLCIVSALSNTLSGAMVFGVSLMVSIIALVALCCMVRFVFRLLFVLWG